MKQIRVRFEAESGLDGIEVVIRASEEDAQVDAVRRRLSDLAPQTLTVFNEHDSRKILPLEEIVCASVSGKLINVVTESGSYFTRQPLNKLTRTLSGEHFVRISRYEIVNLAKVESFDFTLAGTLRLVLAGGTETWASRRCIPEIRRRLSGKG